MAEKNLLYEVVKAFARVDLSPERVDNVQMGYVFEELIRVGAEQSNEEAGEHFTPREVIKLMANLLLSPENDLRRSHVVKTIYDPACGTGGMLSVAEKYIRDLNARARPVLYGQDWNDEAWAVCRADMLIKGEDDDNPGQGRAVPSRLRQRRGEHLPGLQALLRQDRAARSLRAGPARGAETRAGPGPGLPLVSSSCSTATVVSSSRTRPSAATRRSSGSATRWRCSTSASARSSARRTGSSSSRSRRRPAGASR